MIKIIFSIIFVLASFGFAEEAPKGDKNVTANSVHVDDSKINTDCVGDQDCAKTIGLDKVKDKTEAKLTDNATKACTTCKQPTKGRITSKTGVHATKGSAKTNDEQNDNAKNADRQPKK